MPAVKRVDWSPKKRATAVTLQTEGYSYREIAAKIGQGVSPAGVLKLCRRFDETGTIQNKSGTGRKMATTPQTDRRIVRLALKNRKSCAVDINMSLADTGVTVSDRTVRRRLVKAGLRARIPRKKPFLNTAQRLKRLKWAKQHVIWTSEQWSRVLWSDETRISIKWCPLCSPPTGRRLSARVHHSHHETSSEYYGVGMYVQRPCGPSPSSGGDS